MTPALAEALTPYVFITKATERMRAAHTIALAISVISQVPFQQWKEKRRLRLYLLNEAQLRG